MNEINSYYKPLFLSYNYEISQNKLLSNVDPIKNKRDKINFAVILTKKEKWNIFLLFSNMCLKETINLTLLVVIIASGAIGSVIFGLLADIYGRKKIIIVLLSLICFGFSFLLAITFFILGQDFTEELNLSNYFENKESGYMYNLIGVITHLGESSMSGHFIAYCKDPLNGKWYKYNDAIVDEVKDFKKEVIDFAMPYLLFYQKKSF